MIDKFEKYDIALHGVRVPKITFDAKTLAKVSLPETATNVEFLKALCNKGFKEKSEQWKKEGKITKYKERAKYELEVLERLNFIDYILIVWDAVNWCQENDIPVGPGRGSASGCFLLFLIGVTKMIDPIEHGLFFERFVSEARAKKKVIDDIIYLDGGSIADIDIDVDIFKREKLRDYLKIRYPNRTCKTLTVGTLQGKSLIKDCGKIIGEKTEDEMSNVTSFLKVEYGRVEDIEEAYQTNPEFKEWASNNELIYKTALSLRELNRNFGVHASSLLICHDELDESLPIGLSSDKSTVSGYTMEWATISNLKGDFLGLKCLSSIDSCCKMLGIKYEDIDIKSYDKIYKHLDDLKYPYGIFQVEADATFRACQKIRPKKFEDVMALIAITRPGCSQFVDRYSKFTNNGVIESLDPHLDKVLGETANIPLFQEDLMRIANQVFGMTLGEADGIRKACGKKKREEMEKYKDKIYSQAELLKLPKETADKYWELLIDSADYSFNKSHSASYGCLTAITTYLKFNHPKEFFLSLLRMAVNESESLEEIATISKEMKHFGIQLLGPDLLKSNMDFSIEGENVRFGLSAVKHISEKVMDKLINFRKEYGSMVEMFCAAKESGISIGVLAALIQAGAMSSYQNGLSRSKLVLYAQTWNLLTDREKVLIKTLSENTNEQNILKLIKECVEERKNEKGKPLIKESRFETIKKHYEPYKAIYEQNSKNEKLSSFVYEVGVLGFSYSEKLAEIYKETNPLVLSIQEAKEAEDKESVLFVGIVKEVIARKSKASGNDYIKLTITDQDSQCDALIFSGGRENKIEKCRENNGGLLPKEEDCVIIRGNKKGKDAFYVEDLGIQQNVVFTSLRELTRAKKKENLENNLEQTENPT